MLYIPKIDDYLTILNDDEVKDFEILVTRLEYNCSCRFQTSEEQSLGKFAELLYFFQTTPNEVEKYVQMVQSKSSDKYVNWYNIEVLNLFNPEL